MTGPGRLQRLKDLASSVKGATSGGPPDPQRYAHLPPEQRARIERNIAAARAGRDAGTAATAIAHEVAETARDTEVVRIPEEVRRRRERAARRPTALLTELLRADEIDPDDTRDPALRAAIAATERAARAAARAPFEAPGAPLVLVERFAMRGREQPGAVLAHLESTGLAGRPDRVFSVHRVPDRISPNVFPHSEDGRLVEWEVVREDGDASPSGAARLTAVERTSHRVDRAEGDAVPLDEEVGLGLLARAGVGPERTLGLSRLLHLRVRVDEKPTGTADMVLGVGVLHTAGDAVDAALDAWAAEGPQRLEPVHGVHVAVLDWGAAAFHVHPAAWRGPILPSPLPWLPSTPAELVESYLRVVGVRARDCYCAAPTTGARGLLDPATGPAQACADGKDRRRITCAGLVVVVYRDTPETVAGRERWAAYQREVLLARLDHASGERARVPGRAGLLLDRVTRSVVPGNGWTGQPSPGSPAPYCREV